MDCLKLNIKTTDNVYVPAEDSYLIMELLSEFIDKLDKSNLSILDMGSGTGILGMCLGSNKKAKKVTFADISSDAIKLTKENILLNKLYIVAETKVIQSDLFSTIGSEEFDIISFNPPYLPNEDNKELMKDAFYGGWSGIETTKRFLLEAKDHLSKGGAVFIVASSLSDISSLFIYAKSLGFKILLEKKQHIFFEDIIAVALGLNDK